MFQRRKSDLVDINHSTHSSTTRTASLHQQGQAENVIVVVHLSARSIVFRDHVKRADKTVRQVLEQASNMLYNDDGDDDDDDTSSGDLDAFSDNGQDNDDDDDDDSLSMGSDESGTSNNHNDNDNNNSNPHHHHQQQQQHHRSLLQDHMRSSVRGSLRGLTGQESMHQLHAYNKEMDAELQTLARDMVPELRNRDICGVSERSLEIQDFQVRHVKALPALEFTGDNAVWEAWLQSASQTDNGNTVAEQGDWTVAESEVVQLLQDQQACVKTIKNTGSEWADLMKRFTTPQKNARTGKFPKQLQDTPPRPNDNFPFSCFGTSTSLLPAGGKKMRCYGSLTAYTAGLVFALPTFENNAAAQDAAQEQSSTWAWPAGYAAKTEFNIEHGHLINGRREALVSLSQLRQYNDEYLHNKEHYIGGKIIEGGFKVVPYNEVYLRVGGRGRIVAEKDVATGKDCIDADGTGRSFTTGCGLPIALFTRTAKITDIISLLRIQSRLAHCLGREHFDGLPLLLIDHEIGVRVFTAAMQVQFWKFVTHKVNPFQNPLLVHGTRWEHVCPSTVERKMQELIDIDYDDQLLSCKEYARIAGGFGVTDKSLLAIFKGALVHGKGGWFPFPKTNHLQDIVTEALAYAVRADDHYTARQALILYIVVWSKTLKQKKKKEANAILSKMNEGASLFLDVSLLKPSSQKVDREPSLPPPLDTKRVRIATHSPGLLVVFGAAQILASLRDENTKRRAEESFRAVEEWIDKGKKNMAFRVSSWQEQRGAQRNLVAAETDSLFLAFVSQKAIKNRQKFAQQLRKSVQNYSSVRFLRSIHEILNSMKHPSLRLELIQYILGLDNRYSITNVKESVKLAATCMSLC